MNYLKLCNYSKFFVIFVIFLLFLNGCQQKQLNPDSEKIKKLEEEMINIKLQNEKINKYMIEQKNDLEIIKQHLVPSYKAKVQPENQAASEEVETVTVTEQVKTTTKKVVVPETVDQKERHSKKKPPPVMDSEEAKMPQTSAPPKEAKKPPSKHIDKDPQAITPPEKTKTKTPVDRKIPEALPSSRNIPERKINVPPAPEPLEPAGLKSSRNIEYNFDDIMTHPHKQYIAVLSTIGNILDRDSGKFYPEEVITKAEYLTWLFKTYNIYHNNALKPAKKQKNIPDIYDDVPPSHKAYPYIQGLANAGLLVAFNNDRVLCPDDPISREEMLAFAEYFQRQEPDRQLSQLTPSYCNLFIGAFVSDGMKVNQDYSKMIYRSLYESNLIQKSFRVFDKKIAILIPQKAVTRAQAAASLCFIHGLEPYRLGFVLKDYYEDSKKKVS